MSEITVNEILALRDLITNLSPNLALSLAEQINEMVDLGAPVVESVPIQDIQERPESVLSTVFSLSAPMTADILLIVTQETAALLVALMEGQTEAASVGPLTEPKVQKLATAMQGVTRGFATALTNLTGDVTEVESCTTHQGPITLPPVFAMEGSAVQATLSLNLPQAPEAALTFILIPQLVQALVSNGDDTASAPQGGGDPALSEDDLAAMLGDLGNLSGPEPSPVPQSSSFPSFAAPDSSPTIPRGMELILDIPLDVTVELGRVRMLIKDVLDLSSGSIVELDRVAGEPVDLLVNGRLIAKGEVVVIEDNFGIRVTEIISPADRVAGLGKGR